MNNLKMLRGQLGLTQREAASKIGMGRQRYCEVEKSSKWGVSKQHLDKMCEVFNTNPVYLLGEDNLLFKPQNNEEIDYIISILEKMKV